jgi:parvulin-like peptidyl-prolyl isomerase
MTLRVLRAGLLLTGLSLLLAAGCSRKIREYKPGVTYKPDDVVARVDSQRMSWDQMDKRARNFLKEEVDAKKLFIPAGGEEEALGFFRRKALTLFVNKTVMLKEAKRRGIEISTADRKKFIAEVEGVLKERGLAQSLDEFFRKSPLGEKETRREFEDGLYVDRLIQDAVRSKIVVTEDDRKTLITEISAKRREARAKAEELRLQLVKGADFATLARENTRADDKRVIGGDMGEIQRGRFGDKQVEDQLFAQKLNEIGPVVESARAFLVLKVTSRAPAKPAVGATPAVPESVRASYLSVRTLPILNGKDLDRVLQARKFDKDLADLLKNARAKSKIETIYTDLRFD